MSWQRIETAPKDGRAILLLSRAYTTQNEFHGPGEPDEFYHAPKCNIGCWYADGTSWVDEFGQPGDGCYELAVTGVWLSGGGWFQPNEVTHWMPLPLPPEEPTEEPE